MVGEISDVLVVEVPTKLEPLEPHITRGYGRLLALYGHAYRNILEEQNRTSRR